MKVAVSKDKIHPRILGVVTINPNCGAVVVVREIEGKLFLDEAFFINGSGIEGENLEFLGMWVNQDKIEINGR